MIWEKILDILRGKVYTPYVQYDFRFIKWIHTNAQKNKTKRKQTVLYQWSLNFLFLYFLIWKDDIIREKSLESTN